MGRVVDYFLAPQSPWAYLGHQRFVALAKEAGAVVRVRPVDLGGKVFPVSGGLPLPQRAPQRQAYRLLELKRYSEHLKMPLTLQPRYFPVVGDLASCLIIAVDLHDGSETAMKFAAAVLAAVWTQERNIADEAVLGALLAECGLDAARQAQSDSQDVRERYAAYTQEAIDAGVFGAPSYVVDGEIFWGQDRLDFLSRKLQAQ